MSSTGPFHTRAQLEDAISSAVAKFEKELRGRGPHETQTFVLGDMILIRLKGVLIPTEQHLLAGDASESGTRLVKQMSDALIEKGRSWMEEMVARLAGRRVLSLHADTSTRTDETVIVLTLDREVNFQTTT